MGHFPCASFPFYPCPQQAMGTRRVVQGVLDPLLLPLPLPSFALQSPQCCPLAKLNRSQLTQEPARSAPRQQPRLGQRENERERSRATKDTKLPAEGGPQILPARAEPLTQPPKLMDDSERRRSTWAPHQHHPALLKRSSRVAAGAWVAVSPSQRAAHTGHLRSRAPRTASAKRCSPAPRRNEEGPCRSQSPSGICCPGVIFVSHFLALWRFTYFSRAHERPKRKPGTITHRRELRRNPNPEGLSEISC